MLVFLFGVIVGEEADAVRCSGLCDLSTNG